MQETPPAQAEFAEEEKPEESQGKSAVEAVATRKKKKTKVAPAAKKPGIVKDAGVIKATKKPGSWKPCLLCLKKPEARLGCCRACWVLLGLAFACFATRLYHSSTCSDGKSVFKMFGPCPEIHGLPVLR